MLGRCSSRGRYPGVVIVTYYNITSAVGIGFKYNQVWTAGIVSSVVSQIYGTSQAAIVGGICPTAAIAIKNSRCGETSIIYHLIRIISVGKSKLRA